MPNSALLQPYRYLSLLLVCLLPYSISSAQADDIAQTADNSKRPRIGLVLSGGGARGMAHVGVLQVLHDNHIPVDVISGTSMGSIVGGFYASGLTVDEVNTLMLTLPWSEAFRDSKGRDQKPMRRKQEDFEQLIDYQLILKDGKIVLPKGVLYGQNWMLMLRASLAHAAEDRSFDELPIPFRTVATDLVNGEEVVLSEGDLAIAIRASMAFPGALEPVKLNGRLLVDGGVVNNIPTSLAKAMGADVLIVVNIGTPLKKRKELESFLSVTGQTSNIMGIKQQEESLRQLSSQDILITPDLGDSSIFSFDQTEALIKAGKEATEASLKKLSTLALSEPQWEAYQKNLNNRRLQIPLAPVIDRIELNNNSSVSDTLLMSLLEIKTGEALDIKQLENSLNRIYGLGYFEIVDYKLIQQQQQTVLKITATEKPGHDNYFKFGMTLSDDFSGNGSYSLTTVYTRVTERGNEWRSLAQLGNEHLFYSELFVPLNRDVDYFVLPRIEYQSRQLNIFDDDHKRVGEYDAEIFIGSVAIGHHFSNLAEIKGGIHSYKANANTTTSTDQSPSANFHNSGIFISASIDTLDDVAFPRKGFYIHSSYSEQLESFDSDWAYSNFSNDFHYAHSWNKNTLFGSIALNQTIKSDQPLYGFQSLGGFFRLSGYARDELLGPQMLFARLIGFHHLNQQKFSLMDQPAFVGLSLEGGNIWTKRSDISSSDLLLGYTAFIGIKTFLGPIYFGHGYTKEGQHRTYLHLGHGF